MNIYDVAKMAGVSIATASKALNGRKDVREETRARVAEVAKRINYHPSHMARGLAKRMTENIGLVALRRFHVPFFTNPFYSRVIEGMEIEVTKSNYNLLLTVVPAENMGDEILFPKMVREKNVDGLCLLGEIPEAFLTEVASRGIPTVVVDFYSDKVPGHYVVSDNAGGAAIAAEHLLGLGHRNIAFVGDVLKDASFEERRRGFEKALAKAGIKAAKALDVDIASKNAPAQVAAYLQDPSCPSALFCCNDAHAFLVLGEARKLGISVPSQLSVVGFDDIDEAALAQPGLTTLHVEKQEMGAKAIHIVLDLIAHPEASPKRVETPVHLVQRSSTAKPRA
jgi:DNA-binding LacI/PurR family transcriptional regulator